MKADIWYRNYENHRTALINLKKEFEDRCAQLDIRPYEVLKEFSNEFIIRAVHESNWQEGLELSVGKTQQLANMAFEENIDIKGPHLDFNRLLVQHKYAVLQMRRDERPTEEIGAYNLAKAHAYLNLIAYDMLTRQNALLAEALRSIKVIYDENKGSLDHKTSKSIERGYEVLKSMTEDQSPLISPMTGMQKTRGQLIESLINLGHKDLLSPMKCAYINFLHRILMMGILSPSQCGKFRIGAVHVGNQGLYFPPSSAVKPMMEEFCENFPALGWGFKDSYDPILSAAKTSHRFVSIHPYGDGNGRISRLIMNLVLYGQTPPVYLKADKKGRRRYGVALRRADRGDYQPLASLISMSLIEIYSKLIKSLNC